MTDLHDLQISKKNAATEKTAKDALDEAASIRSELKGLQTGQTDMPAAAINKKLEKMQAREPF